MHSGLLRAAPRLQPHCIAGQRTPLHERIGDDRDLSNEFKLRAWLQITLRHSEIDAVAVIIIAIAEAQLLGFAGRGYSGRPRDKRWTAGFGGHPTAPTGEGTLGSGKWQIMPGAAARRGIKRCLDFIARSGRRLGSQRRARGPQEGSRFMARAHPQRARLARKGHGCHTPVAGSLRPLTTRDADRGTV
jgi:hypothetical protein